MSSIGGKKREVNEGSFTKRVGLFEATVIAINPDVEAYKEILGQELKEDSKATEYLGESKEDANTTLRVDFWLQEVKADNKMKVTFFLEDKEKENKDQTKKQYINDVGICSWAADKKSLPDWFLKKDFRVARVGEEELYGFLRTWLGALDLRADGSILEIDWKKLMKGNVKDLQAQIDGEYSTSLVALATVKTVVKDGEENKQYQGVYNKMFLPAYALKHFRVVDYDDEKVIARLSAKKTKDLKIHEKFVVAVSGEYGCKDFYKLTEVEDYDESENIVANDNAMVSDEEDDAPRKPKAAKVVEDDEDSDY